MKTEITLDKQALAELLKDPEVKVRIHDTVVDAIVRKTVKATQKEVEKRVLEHTDKLIHAVLHRDCGQAFYPNRDDTIVRLAQDAKTAIRNEVNTAFMQQARDIVYERLNKLEDGIRKQVDETWKLLMKRDRISEVVTNHIEELIEDGLKKALGNRPPHEDDKED